MATIQQRGSSVTRVSVKSLRERRRPRGLAVAAGNPGQRRRHQFRSVQPSRHRVRLELFAHPEDAKPVRVIDLDPVHHRTGDVWHVWVAGINPGQLYAYRADGPYDPSKGQRFNVNRLLLDPFATAISQLPPWDSHRPVDTTPLRQSKTW